MDNTKLTSRMRSNVQELQKPLETSLAQPDTGYLALTNNAVEIIRANLKNQPLTFQFFDVVKSPSGGSTVFEVPVLAGDEAEK